MKKLTLTAAFAWFGAELKNPRWQCSAFAKDGSLVISCWRQFLDVRSDGIQRYEDRLSRWEGNRHGRELLRGHRRQAVERGVPVRLVIATLENREDENATTTECQSAPEDVLHGSESRRSSGCVRQ